MERKWGGATRPHPDFSSLHQCPCGQKFLSHACCNILLRQGLRCVPSVRNSQILMTPLRRGTSLIGTAALVVALLKLESASRCPDSLCRNPVFKEVCLDQEGSPTTIYVCYHLFDWLCGSESPLLRTPESIPHRFSGSARAFQGFFVRDAVVGAAGDRVCVV